MAFHLRATELHDAAPKFLEGIGFAGAYFNGPHSRARRSGAATFAEAITVAHSAVMAGPVMHMGGAFMPALTHAVSKHETKHASKVWAEPDTKLNSHKTVGLSPARGINQASESWKVLAMTQEKP
jgi:hypothetical protein